MWPFPQLSIHQPSIRLDWTPVALDKWAKPVILLLYAGKDDAGSGMPASMLTMHGHHPSLEPLTPAGTQGQWAKICSPRSHTTPCAPWRLEALSPSSRGAQIEQVCAGSPNQVPQSQSEDDQRNRYGASSYTQRSGRCG